MKIDEGTQCLVTGGTVKKITAKICHHVYCNGDKKGYHNYINHCGRAYDLHNRAVNWSRYRGQVCDIYGDFLPPKRTATGRIVQRFIVLCVELCDEGGVA